LHLLGRDLPGVGVLDEELRDIAVTVGSRADLREVIALRMRVPAAPGVPSFEADPRLLAALLDDPDCEAHLARDPDGVLRGYAFHVRLSRRSVALIGHGAVPEVLQAALRRLGRDGQFPERSGIFFLSTIVTADDDPRPVTWALAGSVVDLMLSEGAYLMLPASPQFREFLRELRAEPLQVDAAEDGTRLDPWLLDLSRYGVEGWMRAVTAGEGEPLPLGEELTAAVRCAVAHLDDDRVLAASPLAALAEPDDDRDPAARAGAVRELLARAVDADGPWPSPDLRVRAALDAVGVSQLPDLGAGPASQRPPGRDEPLRLQLLGDFVLRRGEVSVPVPDGVLSRLVKIVALRGRLPAEELVECLWPDAAPGIGRERLRTALARLRRHIGSDLVLRGGPDIGLGPGVSVDATEFAAAARVALDGPPHPAQLRTAVALYNGELLPQDRAAEWAAGPRELLTQRYLDLLDRLAEAAQRGGRWLEALGWLERGIDADPYDDRRYLIAARLLADNGRRGRALTVLQRAIAAAATLDAEPTAEISELVAELRTR
jgi:DNA-binding SARP family transcriptional activator